MIGYVLLSLVYAIIDKQVTENGLTGSIMTFYEITDGDLSYSTGMSHTQ
jgi:hypothetical protein